MTRTQSNHRMIRTSHFTYSKSRHRSGSGAVQILGGAVCLLAALIVLLQALVIALAEAGLGAGWSSLLVGVVVAVVGVILLRKGSADLSPSELNPDRTQEQLKRDVQVVKEQLK